MRPPNPGRAGFGATIVLYGLLTFLWCGPILLDPAHIAADVGDPLHMAWTMAWVSHQILRDPLALFQSNNFYPYPNSLAFGDHLLPEGLLGLPVNVITGNAVLALNLVTGFGLFSSALAACFVVSKLLDNRAAGLLAGVVLAFNGFMQSELLRVNVLQLQGWCLALYCLWRFTLKPGFGYSVGLSLALLVQGLTGTYYAVYSAILAPGFVVAAYAASRRLPTFSEVIKLVVPAGVVGITGWMFLSPYRLVASMSLAQKPIADGADLASFFLPGPAFSLWGGLLPAAPRGESSHFLGYIPMGLAVLAFADRLMRRSERSPVRDYLFLSAIVLMSLGGLIAAGGFPRFMGTPLGQSPYLSVLQAVPTLRGMATVERASVMVHIGLALLAALGALRWLGGRRAGALALALAGLAAAEQWTKPGSGFRVPAGSELPEVYRFLGTGRGPVVELPVYPDRLLRFRALYPYFSTYHWRKVPIGRASFYPPAHDYFATLLQGFPDDLSRVALDVAGIEDIVVHPRMWTSRRAARLRVLESPDFHLLRVFPEEVSKAARDLEMGDERVYRLKGGPALASPCRPGLEIDRRRVSIRASASEGIERSRDGDIASAWSTVRPQEVGDFLEIDLGEPQPLSAVRIFLGPRTSDFPTALKVEAASEPGAWHDVSRVMPLETAAETLRALIASDPLASITIRMERAQIRSVRLTIASDPSRPGWNPWSVAEIRLFAECSDPVNSEGVTP